MPQQQQQRLTPSDWDGWARSAVTQAFAQSLQETIQETCENWSFEKYLGKDAAETQALNVQALASVSVLRQVVQMIEDAKILPVLPDVGNEHDD